MFKHTHAGVQVRGKVGQLWRWKTSGMACSYRISVTDQIRKTHGGGRGQRAHHIWFLLVTRACLHAGKSYLSSSRLHRALSRGPNERKRLSLHVEVSEAVRPDFPSAFFLWLLFCNPPERTERSGEEAGFQVDTTNSADEQRSLIMADSSGVSLACGGLS